MTAIETPTGQLVDRIEPGSPEWLKRMSASKIAAVMGLSAWDSRFSLYHRMTGLVEPEPDDDMKRRGHYLEPAIAAWFADQLPDITVTETGTFIHPDRSWQSATPDRLVTHPNGHVELLQCKSAAESEHWGEPETDEIPVGYRAQVMWEMDTTGLTTCHVAVILPYLEFRRYVVRYDPAEADLLREEGRAFLDQIEQRIRPDIDDHSATYQVMRELHPLIEAGSVELPADLAHRYLDACAAETDAKAAKRLAASLVLDHMGSAKDAWFDGHKIASRQTKSGPDTVPYLKVARGAVDQFTSRKDAA